MPATSGSSTVVTLHIRVEVHNVLLGHFFGYEGIYSRVEPA